jgi:tripartite-type tricarboxylate transporter receptor subunit TctC
VAAPAGTPAAVLQRLNQEIAKAAEKPRLRDSFIAQGARAVTSTAAEQSRRVDDEIRVWKATIQKANIKLE